MFWEQELRERYFRGVRGSVAICASCGDEFEAWQYGNYTAEEGNVCTDCWFEVLDGPERASQAYDSNLMREVRVWVDGVGGDA